MPSEYDAWRFFYMKMGKNLGFEQNGKGENFVRPVIILKKFNKKRVKRLID
jgi:mRNA interferase MazF